jgi:hypothetical protein
MNPLIYMLLFYPGAIKNTKPPLPRLQHLIATKYYYNLSNSVWRAARNFGSADNFVGGYMCGLDI